MITLEPYDPVDVYIPHGTADDPPRDLTVAYLVRYHSSRIAWLICFDDHAVLWWLPEHNIGVFPDFRQSGWHIGSPYPDSPYWWISGRFDDALEYIYNGIRVGAGENW